jgi:hypothetical protein
MKLDHPTALLIRAACSFRAFDVTDLSTDLDVISDVQNKASKIYANTKDGRSADEVFFSVMLGELGERAFFKICAAAGLEAIHNEEEFSGEYWWDVNVEGAYCEIKYQSKEDPFWFSFNNKKIDKHMVENWDKIDLVIAFYLKENKGRTFVIPWMMIDNVAINPAANYYVDSLRNRGRYLKDSAKDAGLCIEINVNQNKFSF